ncbi:MAG: tyrosine-type recombinase/integrase [Helicobacteraceae bacterium]
MLVDLFWEEYFQYKSLHNKTIGLDQIRYKKYIQKWIGRKDLADVSGADILKIQRDLAENKLSPKTNNNILGVVSAMFSYAIEKDLVPKNPVRSIRKLKINNKRERFLSVDEINTLLQSVKGNEPLELFVLLALSTGARLSSIVNLRVKDVNFANKSVNLLDYKGNSNYTGFLNESTFSKLERFMDCSPNNNLLYKYGSWKYCIQVC